MIKFTGTLAVVFLALFTDMLVYGVIIPILPRLLEDFNRDSSDSGLLVASYAVGLFIFTPIFGYLSDKYQTRKLPFLLGLVGMMACTLLFAFATSFEVLFVARFCQGVSGGASWSIGLSMIADQYSSDSSQLGAAMGIVMAGNVLGQLLGPLIGGLLFNYLTPRSPFYFCTALAFVDLLARLLVNTPMDVKRNVLLTRIGRSADSDANRFSINYHRDSILTTESEAIVESAMSVTAANNTLASSSQSSSQIQLQPASSAPKKFTYLSMFIHPPLFIDFLATIACSNLFSGMLTLVSFDILITLCFITALEPVLPYYFKRVFHTSETVVGLLFSVIVLPNIILASPAGSLSDKFGRKSVSGYALIALAFVVPLLALAEYIGIYGEGVILALIGSVCAFALTPILPDMAEIVNPSSPSNNNSAQYGQVYALFNISYSLGMISGPLLGNLFYEKLGFLWAMVFFSILLFLVGVTMALYARFHSKKRYVFITDPTLLVPISPPLSTV